MVVEATNGMPCREVLLGLAGTVGEVQLATMRKFSWYAAWKAKQNQVIGTSWGPAVGMQHFDEHRIQCHTVCFVPTFEGDEQCPITIEPFFLQESDDVHSMSQYNECHVSRDMCRPSFLSILQCCPIHSFSKAPALYQNVCQESKGSKSNTKCNVR